MGTSPEFEGRGVGVGSLEEPPEASVEAGQAGDSWWMMGTMLSSVMLWPACCWYRFNRIVEVQDPLFSYIPLKILHTVGLVATGC